MNARILDLLSERSPHGASRMFGVAIGVVTNNKDEDGLNRVKLNLPWLGPEHESGWARVIAPMAGNDRGAFFLPEVNDEVLVAFEHGDLRFPFVIGSLWNGKDKPPADNADGENNVRVIKSRSGHTIKLNDKEGAETIEIIDAKGANSLVFETANDTITIKAAKDIRLSASDGSIVLEAKEIIATTSGNASVKASGSMAIEAASNLKLAGAHVDIN